MTIVTFSCVMLCLCAALIRGQGTPVTVTAAVANPVDSTNTADKTFDTDATGTTTCGATGAATGTTAATITFTVASSAIYTVVLTSKPDLPATQTLAKMDAATVMVGTTACPVTTTFVAGTGTATYTCPGATGVTGTSIVVTQPTTTTNFVTICNIAVNPPATTTTTTTTTTATTTTKAANTTSKNGNVVRCARLDLLAVMVLTMTAVTKMVAA